MRGQLSKLPRIQSITGLMLFSLVIPVALLSLFPHQEARFIIPILVPLVYLFGNQLFENESDGPKSRKFKKLLRCSWYTLNAILTFFFGFIHQGGIYPLTNTLYHEIKSTYGTNTHIITTHSYSIPTFLLQLESTSKIWRDRKTGHKYKLAPTTFIHKYGSMPMDELFLRVDEVFTEAERSLYESKKRYRFYVVAPCSMDRQLRESASTYYYISVVDDIQYYPHFCSEALPQFPSNRDKYCLEHNALRKNESHLVDLNMLQRISCFLKRFCLKVYSVKPIGKRT